MGLINARFEVDIILSKNKHGFHGGFSRTFEGRESRGGVDRIRIRYSMAAALVRLEPARLPAFTLVALPADEPGGSRFLLQSSYLRLSTSGLAVAVQTISLDHQSALMSAFDSLFLLGGDGGRGRGVQLSCSA